MLSFPAEHAVGLLSCGDLGRLADNRRAIKKQAVHLNN